MRTRFLLITLCLTLGGLLSVLPVMAQQVCPAGEMRVNGKCGVVAISSLPAGWSKIEPGGETMCAHGTPYAYWVHPGTRNDLLVYLQGGGGCWNADTCRDDGREFNGFYDSRVSENDRPARDGGLLNLTHPENPFSDYTIVYAPVCTGDVHWGQNTYTYEDADEGDVTIHFNGFINTQAAIQWAYANVPEPDSVFVTGCSAGSAGSIVHAPYIIEHYPDTRVAQFGDSLSLILAGPADLQIDWHAHDSFPQWIPELAAMQPLDWTMAKLYRAIAQHYPDYTFSQFNTVRDEVQVFYTFPDGSGDGDDWTPLLDEHLATIQAAAPNYRAFTAGGDLHCITPRDLFYSYAIAGIKLVDWVTALANGEDVPILHCEDCDTAEIKR
jgi:hypothetical protein